MISWLGTGLIDNLFFTVQCDILKWDLMEHLPKRKILTKRIDIRRTRICRDFLCGMYSHIYNNTIFYKTERVCEFLSTCSCTEHIETLRIELHNLLVKTVLYSIVHVKMQNRVGRSSVKFGCDVAQLVVRRLAVRQARAQFSARHPRAAFPTELTGVIS